jgi:hypothetical protein
VLPSSTSEIGIQGRRNVHHHQPTILNMVGDLLCVDAQHLGQAIISPRISLEVWT